jgi:hypothetical protein
VAELLSEVLPVLLALAPAVREAVGLTVSVLLPLRVLEGELLGVPERVGEALAVSLALAPGVTGGEALPLTVLLEL